MCNPFLLDSESRLAHWKHFRKSLVGKDAIEQVDAVAKYWSLAPLGICAYDMDFPVTWSNPWDMLYHNQWCRSAVAIGMDHTLRLIGIEAERMKLQLITDDLYHDLLVLHVDNTYVLNYAWGLVHSLPLINHEVIREWQFSDRGYFQL